RRACAAPAARRSCPDASRASAARSRAASSASRTPPGRGGPERRGLRGRREPSWAAREWELGSCARRRRRGEELVGIPGPEPKALVRKTDLVTSGPGRAALDRPAQPEEAPREPRRSGERPRTTWNLSRGRRGERLRASALESAA